MEELITQYITELNSLYHSGESTESSYRTPLYNLIHGMLPHVVVVHEPKRSPYGVPDFMLQKDGVAVSFIETKKIGDKDLEGENEKQHKEQFDRYKEALDTIVFTDYLTFFLYEKGEMVSSSTIAVEKTGDICAVDDEKEWNGFQDIVNKLGNASPSSISSPQRLAVIMASKAKLIASIISNAMQENKTSEDHALHSKHGTFKKILVHDMTEEQFADFYAQTIVYGLFIARYEDKDSTDFSRLKASTLIPSYNPFLKLIFANIALAELHSKIGWIVDDLTEIFKVTKMERVMRNYGAGTGRKDPVVHFYEEFLEQYNPKIRDQFGVWYTPKPIVKFIVNSVHDLLQSVFHIDDGMASNRKTPEGHHKVQILDPATGTGTFLAETCQLIRSYYKGQEGMWPEDVVKHIIPRLNGFEYLMAPYTMAHLKLATALGLKELGEEQPERLNIFLTNSLEEYKKVQTLGFGAYISEEANSANKIKQETPVMVVIGNPPYNEKSANDGDWIKGLIDDYKQEPGLKQIVIQKKKNKGTIRKNTLKETNPKGLNNDYCKFIRLGQHFVDRTGEGILAYITANTFLDTKLFRGMRYNLLESFDQIYIINLHGSTMRSESTEERPDESVFNIRQGVSINIFVRDREHDSNGGLGKVYYKDLYGSRNDKFEYLSTHALSQIDFEEIEPLAPNYKFRIIDKTVTETYKKGFGINELMIKKVQGFKTEKDHVAIQKDKDSIIKICNDMINEQINISQLYDKYHLKDSRDWKLDKARQRLRISQQWEQKVCEVQYRPFDTRWSLYDLALITSPRTLIQSSVFGKENYMLSLGQQGNVQGDSIWSLSFITDKPTDTNMVPRGGSYLFPLYIYDGFICTPNFQPDVLGEIQSSLGIAMQEDFKQPRQDGYFLPIDLFDYIYAVINSPVFRETYNEQMQDSFPRIPYPTDSDYFFNMVEKGEELRQLHLLKNISPADYLMQFPVPGNKIVEKREYELTGNDVGRVWINKTQYFDGMPENVWNMVISGYQMADTWLKLRQGECLSNDEIRTYQAMIHAMKRTIEVQEEIDQIIRL